MADKQATFRIKTSLDLRGIEKDLEELRKKLQKFKIKTNTKDATQDIKELENAIQGLNAQFTAMNQKMTGMARKLKTTTKQTGKLNTGLKQTKNALVDVSRRVFIWGSMSAAIFGTIVAIKELYDMTLKVNTALGELKKVIPTSEDFGRLKGVAFDVSIEFGQDPLAALQIMKRFAQSGLTVDESLRATRTAMLGINVTGAETEQMFNALIGANRIFGISFEESARVIDKVQRVQARYAVDTKDLIAAVTAIGPAITVLKGDINDLFGIIGAMVEAARISGKEASNSLKRVLARIVAPDGIAALERVNVKVMENADSFRSLRAIVNDLAKVWPELTQVEKQSLSVTLAQVRQYPKFFAWIQNVQRGLEATKDSQQAFGESLRANRAIMNTYQKELDVASAQIAKFAEGFYTAERGSTGLAAKIVDVKARLGEFVATFEGFTKATLEITSIVGGATLAITILGASLGKATGGWKAHKKAVKASGRAALVAAGGMRALSTSVLAALPAVLLIGAAVAGLIVYFNTSSRAQRRYDRVIKDSIGVMKEYKKSLRDISFEGIITSAVEAKFEKIREVLDDFSDKSFDVVEDVKNMQDAFAQLLYAKDIQLLDQGQLDTIQKTLQRFAEVTRTSILAPVHEATNELFSDINAQANKLGTDLESSKIADLGRLLGVKERDWTFVSPDEIRRMQELSRRAKTFREGGAISPIGGRLSAAEREELSLLRQRVHSLDMWVRAYTSGVETIVLALEKQAEALKEIEGLETDVAKERRKEIGAEYTAVVEQQADRLLNLIDVDKKIAEAIVASGEIQGATIISLGKTFKAEAQKDILEALKTGIQKRVEELVGAKIALADQARISEELAKTFLKLGQDAGIKTITFDMTGFLSNLKKATAFMATRIGTALDAAKIADTFIGKKEVYDGVAERIGIIDDGIRNVISNMADNAQQINEYSTQLKGLQLVAEKMAADPALAYRDEKQYKAVTDRIEKLKQDLAALNTAQKNSTAIYKPIIRFLSQYKIALTGLQAEEKLRITNIKSWAKQLETVSKLAGQIADVQITDPIKGLNAQLKRNRELFELQKDNIAVLKETGKLSDIDLAKLQQKVHAQAELNEQTIFYSGILQEAKDVQAQIVDRSDSIAEAMTGVFVSTEEWLDLLREEGGFGDLIIRQIHAIGDAIGQIETDIIAKALSEKIQSSEFVRDLQDEMDILKKQAADNLTEALKSRAYIGSVQEPLIEAGEEIAVTIKDALLEAGKVWEAMLAEQLSETAIREARRAATVEDTKTDVPPSPEVPTAAPAGPGAESIPEFLDRVLPEITAPSPFVGEYTPADAEPWQAMAKDMGILAEVSADAYTTSQKTFAQIKEQLITDLESASTQEEIRAILEQMYATMQQAPDVKETSDIQKKANLALAQRLGSIVSLAIGSFVAKSQGRSNEFVGVGSTIGGIIGTFGGPAGVLGGKFLGGILGGLFGGKEEPDVEEVKATLKNIESNTAKMVDRLTPELINPPAGFRLPSGRGFGMSVTMTNTFIVQDNAGEAVTEIESQLTDLMNRATSYSEIR